MRDIRNMALASLAAFALLIPSVDIDAQVRRTTTTTNQQRTNTGSTQQRSTTTRSTSGTQQRQTGTTTQRSTQQRSNTGSTQNRSTTTRSSFGSQQRQTGTTTQRQTGTVQRQSSSSTQRQTGTTVQRQTGNTNTNRQGTATQRQSSSSTQRQNGVNAQRQSSSSSSSTRQTGTAVQRQSGTSNTRQRQTGTTITRQSGSSSVRQSTSTGTVRMDNAAVGNYNNYNRNDNVTRDERQSSSSGAVRSNTNVTRNGLGTVTSQMRSQSGSSVRQNSGSRGPSRMDNSKDFRIEDHNVHRIPPRDRDFMSYDRPSHFYDHHHPHCFGYRVEVLPPRYKVVTYYGVNYYMYNDVYYRPYGGHYIVCRPPFGVTIALPIANLTFAAVNFAYYSNVYRTYSTIDANNRYIDQQNRIIAQNNATILAQNRSIAMNPNAAMSSYEIANRLGLVQSYAYADRNYFYQDGIFYIVNGSGQYQVIVPPAGALVQALPEDYDIITLNGVQYYRVDDTVYRLTLVSGTPYLEVLGQMYGQMARNYSYGY